MKTRNVGNVFQSDLNGKEYPFLLLGLRLRNEDIFTHSKSKDCIDGEMRVKNEIEWRQSYAQKGSKMTSIIEKIVQ